ncbi:MAG: YebC/PmpR family DNA-binding transcriptional regulator [Patescibacteria group bacterium]|jgi:YebC/PmpR family DNA-binding regulatory protein
MSGHSKWSQIKRQKGAKDVKRSGIFSKLAKAITIAARSGPDPKDNFKLRLAVQKAREANMPNDNVERAIKRASNTENGTIIEEVLYEGYGPGGSAFMISALTDNKNRTVAEIRHMVGEYGGNLGNSGSVNWQFASKGVYRISNEALAVTDRSALELDAIDAGADDVREETEGLTILTDPKNAEQLTTFLRERNIITASAGIEYVPTTTVHLDDTSHAKLMHMIEQLEEHDDVDAIFTNADV